MGLAPDCCACTNPQGRRRTEVRPTGGGSLASELFLVHLQARLQPAAAGLDPGAESLDIGLAIGTQGLKLGFHLGLGGQGGQCAAERQEQERLTQFHRRVSD